MVISRLTGGLGNQIFQYAAAKQASESSGRPLLLDTSYVSDQKDRAFELESLGISEAVWRHSTLPRRARRLDALDTAAVTIGARAKVIREAAYEYRGPIPITHRRNYLIGYWQSPKYFAGISDALRSRVAEVQLVHAAREIEAEIVRHNSVAIHVRRGDYVSDSNAAVRHGTCGIDYYHGALELIRARVADPKLFVFSDDIPWCIENLGVTDATFVSETRAAYEDMILMSRAKHNVIANSSFSWWGAWLGGPAGRVVVAPRKWFAGLDQSTVDLIPGTWVRI